jgi:uncharacterized protein
LQTAADIRKRFETALEGFIRKIKQDSYILAAILMGSLSYDQVWEKSDIDMVVIVKDEKLVVNHYCVNENGILINASIMTRSSFKRMQEGALGGSMGHSFYCRSTLLFTHDETIREYYDNIRYIGERDKSVELMKNGCWAIGSLAKAQKWLSIKKDVTYCFHWITRMTIPLANMEALMNGEVPMREVIQQALQFNPEFFHCIYTDLIHGEKTEAVLQGVLEKVEKYLEERSEKLFALIIKYLADAREVRTMTEIAERFSKLSHMETFMLVEICDWLAEKGMIQKVLTPVRLTPKSRVQVEEAAYYNEQGH